MKEIMPTGSSIENILSGCVMENGKLVPAPQLTSEQVEVLNGEIIPYQQSDVDQDSDSYIDDRNTGEYRRRKFISRRVMARTAIVGAMVLLPIQAGDALLSNRPFLEVNIAADIADRASKAELIGNNISTTFNSIKTTTDNIVKLANGGK